MQVETAPPSPTSAPAPAPPGGLASSRTRDPWPVVVLALALAVIVLNAARGPFDSDGWWHLRSGDLILDRGSLPREDPFAWTAAGEPWRLNSWLFDVLAAASRSIAGRGPLITFTLLAFAGFGVACYLLARRAGAREWPSVAVASTFTVLLTPWVAERPHMLTYLFFAATLVLAPRALAGSNRALLAQVALIVVWVNFHLATTVGVALIAILAFASVVRTRRLTRPLVVTAAAALASLCSPFGISVYTAAFESRTTSHLIKEWQPVDLMDPGDIAIVVVALVALLSLWHTGRWRRLDCILPVAVFAALTFDAVRNSPFLLLVASAEVALGLSALRAPRLHGALRPRSTAVVHGLVLGLVLAAALQLPNLAEARSAPGEWYPVRGTRAIPAGCRLLNEDAFGGYITDKRWPEVLVSQDGRNGSEQDLERQRLVLAGRPGALEWINQHRVGCVLAAPDRPLVDLLRAEDWRVTAKDPSAVLLMRP